MAGAAKKKAQAAKQKSPTAPKTRRAASASELAARKAVIATALQMSHSGLSPGRSGNVSQRFDDGMLITPSGMAYDVIKPADIVFVASDGTVAPKSRKPSSEWRFHLAAYGARPDGNAIVHTHSVYATVLACTGKPIPAFHYMVAIAGGRDIPCVPYATFGTEQLSEYVADGLRQRDACLMANHGQITIATSLISEGIQMQEIRKTGFKLPPETVQLELDEFLKKKGMTLDKFKQALDESGYEYAYFIKKFENQITINRYVEEKVFSGIGNDRDKRNQYSDWFNNASLLAEVVYFDRQLETLVKNSSGGSGCGSSCTSQKKS